MSTRTVSAALLVLCLASAACKGASPGGTHPVPLPLSSAPVVATPPPVVPLPDVPPIVYGPLGSIVVGRVRDAVVAESRPLRWSVQTADPLSLAVHLRRAVPPNGTRPMSWLGFDARPAKLTVSFRYPDEQIVTRTVSLDVDAGSRWFGSAPTVFLEFGPTAMRPISPSLLPVDYEEGPLPPWPAGVVGIKIEGALVDSKAKTFETGWVAFDIGPDKPILTQLRDVADAKREELKVPLRSDGSPEAGFVADTLIQLAPEKWVARFAEAKIFSFMLTSIELDGTKTVSGADTRSIRTCVAEGSLVETPGGSSPVEGLEPGDLVIGWDFEAGRRIAVPLMSVSRHRAGATYQLAPNARFSARHPIWNGEWTVAALIEGADAGRRGPATVYRLMVGEPHNFFVGGLLTHNKDRAYAQELDDPWFFMWDPK